MSGDRGVAESRTRALLKEQEVTGAQKRSACVTLADRALIAAEGSRAAAARMLREVLEATGFVPYEPGVARTAIGRRKQAVKGGAGS